MMPPDQHQIPSPHKSASRMAAQDNKPPPTQARPLPGSSTTHGGRRSPQATTAVVQGPPGSRGSQRPAAGGALAAVRQVAACSSTSTAAAAAGAGRSATAQRPSDARHSGIEGAPGLHQAKGVFGTSSSSGGGIVSSASTLQVRYGYAAGDPALQQQAAEYACAVCAPGVPPSRSLSAVHLLNGCFMACRSYESCTDLAAAAVAAAPHLPAALCQLVLGGEPISLLALHCLQYLALAPQAHPLLAEAGLVPLLLGQLRAAAGGCLEAELAAAAADLMLALVRADTGARNTLCGLRGAAGVLGQLLGGRGAAGGAAVAACAGASRPASPAQLAQMQHGAAWLRCAALMLLEEMAMSRKGLDQVTSSPAVAAALEQLSGPEGAHAAAAAATAAAAVASLHQKAVTLRRTLATLQAVMAP